MSINTKNLRSGSNKRIFNATKERHCIVYNIFEYPCKEIHKLTASYTVKRKSDEVAILLHSSLLLFTSKKTVHIFLVKSEEVMVKK